MVEVSRVWPYARVFAHRCGGALAPENTIAGLDVADRYGCGVEFDVMLSADGTPFLMHDETLERTTNGSGRMADIGDAALRALDAGSWFGRAFAGERVPELRDAARRCIERSLHVNLEIKPSPGLESETAGAVGKAVSALWHDVLKPPLLSSFSELALGVVARVAPEIPRGLLVDDIPDDWRERCRRLEVVSIHANARSLDAAQVDALRTAGLWVVAYTENDPVRAGSLFDWGVDCVITDRPDRIRGVST